MDQRGQGRDQMDAAVMSNFRGQRRSTSTSRAGLQSRQFPAHVGDAGADQGLVADQPEGEADQDRRQGRQLWSLRCIPDGRGLHSEKPLRRHPAIDRGTATAARHFDRVRRSMSWVRDKLTGDVGPYDRKIAIFERGMGPIPDAWSIFRQLRRVQLAKGADGSQNWGRIGPLWGMREHSSWPNLPTAEIVAADLDSARTRFIGLESGSASIL